MKEMRKEKIKDMDMLRREIKLLRAVDHPNMIGLHETFEDQQSIYLVMEFCTGGELSDFMKAQGRVSETAAALIAKQMLSAIGYLHGNGIVLGILLRLLLSS